jgi:hypothetical protein
VERYEKVKKIFMAAIPLLLIAQFDLYTSGDYFIGFFSAFLVTFILIYKQYTSRSIFLYIMIMYISSYFRLFEDIGHTFAVANFIYILIYLALKDKKTGEIFINDKLISILIFILFFFNLLGWIFKSQQELRYLIPAIMTFFSLIFIFYLSKRLVWNKTRVGTFYIIVSFMMVYALFTALINTLNIFPFRTPLINSYKLEYSTETVFVSMMQRPGTAAPAMFAVFILPMIYNLYLLKRKTPIWIVIGFATAVLTCIIGFSKSHIIVLIFGLLLTMLLLYFYFGISVTSLVRTYAGSLLFGVLFIILGTVVNYNYIFTRINENPDFSKNFLNDPLRATGTSREDSYRLGLESLERENWFVGYGYANGGINRLAWFGKSNLKYAKLDFHNTYLSLPQLFGWAGAGAYIMLFLITLRRMFILVRNKNIEKIYRVLGLSFFLLFLVHLLTEYTITALTSPHYLFMVFILLGLSNSLYYNYKKGLLFPNLIVRE